MTAYGKSVNIQTNKKNSNVRCTDLTIRDNFNLSENFSNNNNGSIVMGTVDLKDSLINH